MKIKKSLFLFFLTTVTSCIYSQHIYFEPYYSRSFALEKTDFLSVSNSNAMFLNDSVSSISTNTIHHNSLGEGNNYGLLIGYNFPNKILSFEMDFRYFKGKGLSFNNRDYYYFPEEPAYHIEIKDYNEFKSVSFSVTPLLKMTLDYKRWGFFLKSGFLIARCSFNKEDETKIFNSVPNYYPFESYFSVTKYKPKWEFGVQGAIGVSYQLFSWSALVASVQYNAFEYVPESASIITYQHQGEDQLDDLTISKKEFIFSDSHSSADNNLENEPTILYKTTYTYSNFALRFGIRFIIF